MKKKQGYNNFGGNKRYSHHKKNEDVFVKKIEKVEKSEELGFTGPTSNWFDDEEFYKRLPKTENKGEKDYYFNSYSSFYIHEEMIKDKVKKLIN